MAGRHRRPLGRATRAFCWIMIMTLDHIPRYGRWFHVLPDEARLKSLPTLIQGGWRWYWDGNWGCALLHKMGLLGRYVDHHERLAVIHAKQLHKPLDS